MLAQIESVNFLFLTTIFLFCVALAVLFVWGLLGYFKGTGAFKIKSNVVLTKGKVLKKFYSGGDPRISGLPTMKLEFKLEDEIHKIEKEVEQEIFFEYDEGQDIDLFVSTSNELKVYPLKSIQKKEPKHQAL